MEAEEERKPINILLVEDDDDHAKILTRILSGENIIGHVVRVSDGVEALAYLSECKRKSKLDLPQVILLDLKLPKKDGHEVLAEIKEDALLRMIPVIILTTSGVEQDKVRAYEHHANSYLVKPVDIAAFRRMIEDLSFYWGMWNRFPQRGEGSWKT